ncbi:MAG: DUF1800 domain-containing protein [Thermonemataceae bacterium]|nr:DUF1800 domain-containing protein [Thermonemataceae bacterium]
MKEQEKINYLYQRAAFGLGLDDFLEKKSIQREIENLEKKHNILNISILEKPVFKTDIKNLPAEEKKRLQKENRQSIKNINIQWLKQMANPDVAFREKMTLFWHNHFACKSPIAWLNQEQNNTIRKNVLGKFGDLLHAIAKDPAMLQFLNNQQNRKQKPNENFARELMELFTLGRGNYTEQDIKEAARAFTGWGFNFSGEYVFRQRLHDFDEKVFFGKKGNFNGEDIIDIILANPQTAIFITKKIYRYFVNDNPNKEHIKELADRFRKTDYDIKDLMFFIFKSDWFYDENNIGSHIKSPIELLVQYLHFFKINFEDEKALLFIQKVLGQILLLPPNVAGWQEGRAWIDSSSLLLRLTLPDLIFGLQNLDIQAKEEGDIETENFAKGNLKLFKNEMNWSSITNLLEQESNGRIYEILKNWLLQKEIRNTSEKSFLQKSAHLSKSEFVRKAIHHLTTSIEFQVS